MKIDEIMNILTNKIVTLIINYIIPVNSRRRRLAAYLFDKHIVTTWYSIDSPTTGDSEHYQEMVVSGWAIDYNGIKEIQVYCDDIFYGNAMYGSKRMDVKEAFPKFNKSLNSGFICIIDNIEPGDHVIGIKIVTNSGKCVINSMGLKINAYDNMLDAEINSQKSCNWMSKVAAGFKRYPVVCILISGDDSKELHNSVISATKQGYDKTVIVVVSKSNNLNIDDIESAKQLFIVRDDDIATCKDILDKYNCEFVLPLKSGDTLYPKAVFEYVLQLNIQTESSLIYSDHYKKSADETLKSKFYFKPDWSEELALAVNYIGRGFIVTASLFDIYKFCTVTKFDDFCYETILNVASAKKEITRIQKVLNCVISDEEFNVETRLNTINDYMHVAKITGDVTYEATKNIFCVRKDIINKCLVSIVIPTLYDNKELLQKCILSIYKKSTYRNYEIIVINTGKCNLVESDITRLTEDKVKLIVVEYSEQFNWSRVNNIGFSYASGEQVIFLNDDVEIISSDWIQAMLELAQGDNVCAVGAKLLYSNNTIQHAGILLVDHGGGGRHFFLNYPSESEEYFSYLNVIRPSSAVTGACLMIPRPMFNELGGFDENLRIEGNDTDFCLRGGQLGYKVLWTPYAQLYHHEQSTRKEWCVTEDTTYFWNRWKSLLKQGDKYYNRNLSLETDRISVTSRPVFVEHVDPAETVTTEICCKSYTQILPEEINNVLLIKLDHIGDVILSLPAVKMLKKLFPRCRVTMLVAEWSMPIIKLVDEVDEIIMFNAFHKESEKGLRQITAIEEETLRDELNRHNFDVAIDLRRHSDTRHYLKLAGAKYLIGYAAGDDDSWMTTCLEVTDKIENVPMQRTKPHIVAQMCQLIRVLVDGSNSKDISMPVISGERCIYSDKLDVLRQNRLLIGIHAGAGSAIRQWPVEHFVELVNMITNMNAVVILFGTSAEIEVNRTILVSVNNKDVLVDLTNRLSLPEFLDVITKCHLFVGNNSGPSHMAAMQNVPTLSIFSGQVLPDEWQPFGEKVLSIRMNMPCSPCYLSVPDQSYFQMKCLKMLPPERVFEAVQQLMVIAGASF